MVRDPSPRGAAITYLLTPIQHRPYLRSGSGIGWASHHKSPPDWSPTVQPNTQTAHHHSSLHRPPSAERLAAARTDLTGPLDDTGGYYIHVTYRAYSVPRTHPRALSINTQPGTVIPNRSSRSPAPWIDTPLRRAKRCLILRVVCVVRVLYGVFMRVVPACTT